jgi:hypothetical protein
MAILELKRVELHSSKESQWLISNSLIAKVIHTLATIVHFPNPHSDLLLEMEAHLRLLAMALRVYSTFIMATRLILTFTKRCMTALPGFTTFTK